MLLLSLFQTIILMLLSFIKHFDGVSWGSMVTLIPLSDILLSSPYAVLPLLILGLGLLGTILMRFWIALRRKVALLVLTLL